MFGGEHHLFYGPHSLWGLHWAGWVFWGLVIAIIIWLLVRSQRDAVPPASHSDRETPLDVLQRRYAEGEISTEEYEERKKRLDTDR